MKQVYSGLGALLAGAGWSLPAMAQANGQYGHHHDWGGGWGHMLFGGGMMLLFWGGLIALVVLAVGWLGRSNSSDSAGASGSRALEILQERYARGEIEREEYEQRRRDLEGTGSR